MNNGLSNLFNKEWKVIINILKVYFLFHFKEIIQYESLRNLKNTE